MLRTLCAIAWSQKGTKWVRKADAPQLGGDAVRHLAVRAAVDGTPVVTLIPEIRRVPADGDADGPLAAAQLVARKAAVSTAP